MNDDRDFRTWNVFRRCNNKGLCCAVSAGDPVPPFLLSGEWDFGFACAGVDPPMAGFSASAAESGIAFNGFYLFIAWTLGAARHREPARRREPKGGFAHSPRSERPRGAEAEEERCPSIPTA